MCPPHRQQGKPALVLQVEGASGKDDIRTATEGARVRIRHARSQALRSTPTLLALVGTSVRWRFAARFLMPVTMLAFFWAVVSLTSWWGEYSDYCELMKSYPKDHKEKSDA